MKAAWRCTLPPLLLHVCHFFESCGSYDSFHFPWQKFIKTAICDIRWCLCQLLYTCFHFFAWTLRWVSTIEHCEVWVEIAQQEAEKITDSFSFFLIMLRLYGWISLMKSEPAALKHCYSNRIIPTTTHIAIYICTHFQQFQPAFFFWLYKQCIRQGCETSEWAATDGAEGRFHFSNTPSRFNMCMESEEGSFTKNQSEVLFFSAECLRNALFSTSLSGRVEP